MFLFKIDILITITMFFFIVELHFNRLHNNISSKLTIHLWKMFTCIHTFCSNIEKIDFPPFHYQICYCHYFIINISCSVEVRKCALTSFYSNTLLNCYALKINYDLSTDKKHCCIKSSIVYFFVLNSLNKIQNIKFKARVQS